MRTTYVSRPAVRSDGDGSRCFVRIDRLPMLLAKCQRAISACVLSGDDSGSIDRPRRSISPDTRVSIASIRHILQHLASFAHRPDQFANVGPAGDQLAFQFRIGPMTDAVRGRPGFGRHRLRPIARSQGWRSPHCRLIRYVAPIEISSRSSAVARSKPA